MANVRKHLDEAGLDVKPVNNRVAGMRETKSEKIPKNFRSGKVEIRIVLVPEASQKHQTLPKLF